MLLFGFDEWQCFNWVRTAKTIYHRDTSGHRLARGLERPLISGKNRRFVPRENRTNGKKGT